VTGSAAFAALSALFASRRYLMPLLCVGAARWRVVYFCYCLGLAQGGSIPHQDAEHCCYPALHHVLRMLSNLWWGRCLGICAEIASRSMTQSVCWSVDDIDCGWPVGFWLMCGSSKLWHSL